jgi:acyl-CoA reductase-like NAD-dependent aldehyde dehydrogenase
MPATEHEGQLFIGGRWRKASSDRAIDVISPHTEAVIARVAAATPHDVDRAVDAARVAYDHGEWPRLEASDRVETLRQVAKAYSERRAEMSTLISAEMGAPMSFAKAAHVRLPLMMLNTFCDLATEYPWQESRPGLYGRDVLIRSEPVGVVAAVVPWNMPQFLIVTKVIPALLAGCCVILKPAPETPLDALLLADLFAEAGFPDGVISVLPGGKEVGEHLVAHAGIDKVSFTGSTAAGRQVAAACASGLKRVSLELGGKSAAIVLDDAKPADVAAAVRDASLMNSGQICNALTRILVPAARSDEFVDAIAAEMQDLKVGNPSDDATDLGPLVTQRQQARVRDYIEVGQREGARLVAGGVDMPGGTDRGWYVRPTLFSDADNGMRIAREEIFGPVLTVIPYQTDDEAVLIANDSDYGLAGSVFTADLDRGLDIGARVRTGTFGVNQGYIMDPLAPFGGVKASGYGRELGREGIQGFVEPKSISVIPAGARQG